MQLMMGNRSKKHTGEALINIVGTTKLQYYPNHKISPIPAAPLTITINYPQNSKITDYEIIILA